jgi:cell division protein FtsI (penicillin-binding protein 3)
MNQFKIRLFFLCFLLCIGVMAVMVRLFSIQVLHGSEFAARSRSQSQQRCMLPAPRGTIYDRNGKVLAASTLSDVSLAMDVFGAAKKKKGTAVTPRRVYPLGEAEGPLVGYIGRDGYGLGGVEFTFDKYLRGEDGWTILQRDGRNHRYRKVGLPCKEPRRGGEVYLTIDAEIQKIAYSVLKQSVVSQGARGGMCMVMDPSTGNILAMVNEPSFDPNAPGSYPIEVRRNACVSAIYEPGSTFKLVTAAAALDGNTVKEHDILDGNNGVYTIYHESIRDHHPYGKLTFVQAMAFSSNVCFAKVAKAVGSRSLYQCVRDFGFGSRSGIDLPGEENGILHPIRAWSGRTLVTMAIGQEISVTFLQMMLAYAAIANNGVLLKPRICEKAAGSDRTGKEKIAFTPVRRVLSEQNARRLRTMLKTVVDSGTGAKAAIRDIAIAGKTGTAQKIDSGAYSRTRSWASFFGFLPVEKPVLLCGVVIDEPANNLMGGTAAAPVFRKVVTQILSHPGLEFAEKILHDRVAPPLPADNVPGKEIIAGMIPKVRGNGLPALPRGKASGSAAFEPVRAASGLMPNCIGKDARDAVNIVNRLGLMPYVIGAGLVRRQHPPAGSLKSSAPACTLFCSWEG